jgi:hypothetical protein
MNILEEVSGSYCKIVIQPKNSSRSIVQSGFIKNVDTSNKIVTLENENGVVNLPFDQIYAVKKIRMSTPQG